MTEKKDVFQEDKRNFSLPCWLSAYVMQTLQNLENALDKFILFKNWKKGHLINSVMLSLTSKWRITHIPSIIRSVDNHHFNF